MLKSVMPITCQICSKEFKSLITSTHLKTHGITSKDYMATYGRDALASEEYRKSRSIDNSGERNGNYGKHMSESVRKRISEKTKGSTPWNKGIKTGSTNALRTAIDQREEKYRSGELERYRTLHSPETRDRISASVKAYASSYADVIRERVVAGEQTKRNNGYYISKRAQTLTRYIANVNQYGFDVDLQGTTATLRCRACNHTHERSVDSELHENMCPFCGRESTSQFEREIADYVKTALGVTCRVSDKNIIPPLELDIVIPDYNLAIEANGLYWHSETAGKSRFYHRHKTQMANNAGYRLIHVFEDEWLERRDICKQYIRAALGLASECISLTRVEKVSYTTAAEFLTDMHILGCGPVTDICYAAYNGNNIIAVMTFKQHGANFTLERYAAKDSAIGYCKALFDQFVKDYSPACIISYMDLRWETDEIYSILGFVQGGTTLPNYWYVKGTKRIHRYKLRLTEEDSHNNEYETRTRQGYNRIWDCGYSKWEWCKHDFE